MRMNGMRNDLGQTEDQARVQSRKCSDGLLSALQRHHPVPVKIEIKTEPVPDVSALHEKIDWLQGVVSRQREVIKGLCDKDSFAVPRFSEVLEIVCNFYGMTRASVTGTTRTAKIAMPRQIVCYLCRELTRMSLPEIGRKLGGRDHTTILHGVNKIEGLLVVDQILQDDIDVLKAKLEERVLAREALAEGVAA